MRPAVPRSRLQWWWWRQAVACPSVRWCRCLVRDSWSLVVVIVQLSRPAWNPNPSHSSVDDPMAASTVPAASVAALPVVLMLVVLLPPPPPAAAASGQPPGRCAKSELSACYCGRTTYDRQELYAVNCTGTGLNMQQSIGVFLNLPSETEVSDQLSLAVHRRHLVVQK